MTSKVAFLDEVSMKYLKRKSNQGPPLHNAAVFSTIRQMLADGTDFYYDGWQTAIRRIRVSAWTPDEIGSMYRNVLVAGQRCSSMHIGIDLIWAGAASPDLTSDTDRFYLVVTVEGGLPASQTEFDQLVFGSLHQERVGGTAPN